MFVGILQHLLFLTVFAASYITSNVFIRTHRPRVALRIQECPNDTSNGSVLSESRTGSGEGRMKVTVGTRRRDSCLGPEWRGCPWVSVTPCVQMYTGPEYGSVRE